MPPIRNMQVCLLKSSRITICMNWIKEIRCPQWRLHAKKTGWQMVYIKPKRKKGAEKYYTVREGETVYSVSMKLGVKSKFICKYNGLYLDTPLQPGTVLWLQGKKPS